MSGLVTWPLARGRAEPTVRPMTTLLRTLFLGLVLWLSPSPSQAQEWTSAPAADAVATDLPTLPDGWVTVPGTFLRVHGPDDRVDLLLRVARHGSASLPRLADTLEVPIGSTIHVYVADTEERFRTMQPGTPPSWADATAWPGLGVVFLRDPKLRPGTEEPLEQVFDHELVHILLGRAFAPEVPPHWLQEGVAQVLAGQAGPNIARELSQAPLRGGLVDLEALEHGFPADPLRARLAYAESADFVQYLQAEHGDDVVADLVHATAGGAGLSSAIRTATGSFLDDVEADWRRRWSTHASLSSGALAQLDSWVLGLGSLALIVGGILRRRRFHQRLQEMEREEALLDALVAELHARRVSARSG